MAAESGLDEHERRAGKNQSLFRAVNRRVSEINKPRDLWLTLSDWICECADDKCRERIELTPGQYEGVLENPTHFAVIPNEEHVVPEVERVVAKHLRYWVVEKVEHGRGV